MLRLPSKWVNNLLGTDNSFGIYLAPTSIAMTSANENIKPVIQTDITDIVSTLTTCAVELNDERHKQLISYAHIALASHYFDTYVLSFNDFPHNKTEQLALVRWTLTNRKLLDDSNNNDLLLRYQLMGETKKGYKVLVEVLKGEINGTLNEAMLTLSVLPETMGRASHYVYNHFHRTNVVSSPASLVFYEDDTVSVYFWDEDGVLSYYRDYSLLGSPSYTLNEISSDIVSIIRRLELSEWNSQVSNIYTAVSSLLLDVDGRLFESIAEHYPIKKIDILNTKDMMLNLVQSPIL